MHISISGIAKLPMSEMHIFRRNQVPLASITGNITVAFHPRKEWLRDRMTQPKSTSAIYARISDREPAIGREPCQLRQIHLYNALHVHDNLI